MLSSAKWITAGPGSESPIFIRRFRLTEVSPAVLHITSLGFFKVYLNGKEVSGDYFVPVITDYEPRDTVHFLYPIFDQTTHRLYVYSYDVTHLLLPGENILEIHLGNGWYRQTERIAEGHLSFGDQLKAIFALALSDGTAICSDGSESFRESEIIYNNLFIGEVIDPAAVTGKEQPVMLTVAPQSELCRAQGVPDRVIRTVTPTLLGEIDGRKIYDTGENISGIVRITTHAPAGEAITLRFAENLTEAGDLDFATTGADYRCDSGKSQIMTDTFVSDGTPRSFAPTFVWHAFRYFDVVGEIDSAEVLVIHSDVAVTSSFKSDSEGLNFLYNAFIRGQLTNMHGSIPSDCPHRERLGYTGDGQVCAPAGMMLLDSKEFYKKWIIDILDCQDRIGGHVQHTAHFMGGGGGPGGWGSAIILVPYAYYRQFGEIDMLERCYRPMVRWINYLKTRCENGLVVREEADGWCLGDWCTLDPIAIPEPYVNSCYLLKTLSILCEIADILGETQDVPAYQNLMTEVSRAICREYRDENGSFCGGIQGADVYALWCGIAPAEKAGEIAEKYRSLGHFDTGFLATDLLLEVLFVYGYQDTALALLENTDLGTFLYMKQHGATTIWENWDGGGSHNHPMFGGGVRQLFTGILGIHWNGGDRSLVIEPKIPARLSCVKGSLLLPIGRVSVSFENNTFYIDLPSGITAAFRHAGVEKTIQGSQTIPA